MNKPFKLNYEIEHVILSKTETLTFCIIHNIYTVRINIFIEIYLLWPMGFYEAINITFIYNRFYFNSKDYNPTYSAMASWSWFPFKIFCQLF